MNPSALKNYLQQHKRATLQDLSYHFHHDPEAIRGMLDLWLRKGKVRKSAAGGACGSGCNKCNPLATEIYEWLE